MKSHSEKTNRKIERNQTILKPWGLLIDTHTETDIDTYQVELAEETEKIGKRTMEE